MGRWLRDIGRALRLAGCGPSRRRTASGASKIVTGQRAQESFDVSRQPQRLGHAGHRVQERAQVRSIPMDSSPTKTGWAWLGVATFCAALRWSVTSTTAPYREVLPATWFEGASFGLFRLTANAIASLMLLAVVPLLIGWRTGPPNGALRGMGLAEPVSFPSWTLLPTAAALAAAGWWAGSLDAVRNAYPVWQDAGSSLPNLLLSCVLVGIVLLSTEVLYRGVALHAMRRALGMRAIFLILPVYVIDHVGAPWPEVVGSAFTGTALGWLSIRTQSLWPGFLLHASFAWAVDLGALHSTGRLLGSVLR